jgi:hypothetical protein
MMNYQSRLLPLQVIHNATEALPMGEGERSSRFQELRRLQHERVLTEAEEADLALLMREVEEAEGTYLTPATERLRQERETLETQYRILELLAIRKADLVRRLGDFLADAQAKR